MQGLLQETPVNKLRSSSGHIKLGWPSDGSGGRVDPDRPSKRNLQIRCLGDQTQHCDSEFRLPALDKDQDGSVGGRRGCRVRDIHPGTCTWVLLSVVVSVVCGSRARASSLVIISCHHYTYDLYIWGTYLQLTSDGKALLATVEDKMLPVAQSQKFSVGFMFTDSSKTSGKGFDDYFRS